VTPHPSFPQTICRWHLGGLRRRPPPGPLQMASHGDCHELLNVVLSLLALSLSFFAAVTGSIWGTADVLGHSKSILSVVSLGYGGILLLNVASSAAIWLSSFHCECLHGAAVRCLTSPSTLCSLRVLASATFLLQLALAQFLLARHCVMASLAFMCGLPHGMIIETQEVMDALGATPPPHGTVAAFLRIRDPLSSLSLQQYCGSSVGSNDVMLCNWLVCFAAVVSQALMAVALNGEKERVGVHELHEKAGLAVLLEGEFDGLLKQTDHLQALSHQTASKLGSAYATAEDSWGSHALSSGAGRAIGSALGAVKSQGPQPHAAMLAAHMAGQASQQLQELKATHY